MPAGDQPKAISALVSGLDKGLTKQTLLGATGTGKTFTIANVIAKHNKPTLVIAHNKTLAAQLAQEFREFFPDSAVHYFVSYYDYYQPEAYIPTSDTYIEKDAQINEEIDRLRHASTQALLTRKDVIIVASVSCIYGLGSPEEYEKENLKIEIGSKLDRTSLMKKLIGIHFERTNADLSSGQFRSIGGRVEFIPVSETFMYQINFLGNKVSEILKVDPISLKVLAEEKTIFIFPAKHFLTDDKKKELAIKNIKKELTGQIKRFEKEGKLLEADRIKRRTSYDLAMIKEIGYCPGIENYSRHFSFKREGEPPETLLSYFPHVASYEALRGKPLSRKFGEVPDFLTIIDESHVTLPQLKGMYAGDRSRKNTLVEHGFRLPSAKDNRPLRYEEFSERIGQVIYVSATPGEEEKIESKQVVEQIIRPTGLLDPELVVRPVSENRNFKKEVELPDQKFSGAQKESSVHGRQLLVGQKKDNFKNKSSYLGQTLPPSSNAEGYGGQVQDFIKEAQKVVAKGFRVLATTLTKKMAEDLSTYLKNPPKDGVKMKAEYLHSDVKTIDRIKILTEFRKGTFDILIGVNLLREGLDLPEVALIGIFDADKEGFLRSETSLIQTIGRAARNAEGKVILYADFLTRSLESAIKETERRRAIQIAYNKKHNITPKTIIKNIKDITEHLESDHSKAVNAELSLDLELFKNVYATEMKKGMKKVSEKKGKTEVRLNLSDEERERMVYEKIIKLKEREMNKAVKELDFETAAILRDEIGVLRNKIK